MAARYRVSGSCDIVHARGLHLKWDSSARLYFVGLAGSPRYTFPDSKTAPPGTAVKMTSITSSWILAQASTCTPAIIQCF